MYLFVLDLLAVGVSMCEGGWEVTQGAGSRELRELRCGRSL